MNPTRQDLIELGYLRPGDAIARAPKVERRIWLTDADKDYAKHHGLTDQEMKDFKLDMIIEEEIIRDSRMLQAQAKREHNNSPQAVHFAW